MKTLYLSAFLVCVSCGTPVGSIQPPGESVRSSKQRVTDAAPPDNLKKAVEANNQLGFSLLKTAPANENAAFSPYSVNLAMSMVYGGAAGETATAIAKGLHLQLEAANHHRALNSLSAEIASRGKQAQGTKGNPFALRMNNQLFADNKTNPKAPFLDLLATEYGAGIQRLDFVKNPEPSRQAINGWISKNTEQLIQELIPEGRITTDTRFALVNTIYLDAAWKQPFPKDATARRPFQVFAGKTKDVEMMSTRQNGVRWVSNEAFDAVEIPYQGDEVGLLVIVPKKETVTAFSERLSTAVLSDIDAQLTSGTIDLTLPKFQLDTKSQLLPYFVAAGLPLKQDFSNLDDLPLELSDILHQTVIRVDEEGTVAAAATAAIMREVSAPPSLTIDRPFFFVLRDLKNKASLFVGRVVEP